MTLEGPTVTIAHSDSIPPVPLPPVALPAVAAEASDDGHSAVPRAAAPQVGNPKVAMPQVAEMRAPHHRRVPGALDPRAVPNLADYRQPVARASAPMRPAPVARPSVSPRPATPVPNPGAPNPGVPNQSTAANQVPPVRRPALSAREIEVLLAWLACDSKEVAAERLFIAASTVSTHLARIRAKYSEVGRPAPTKTHLLARALQDGITDLEDW